MGEHVIAVDVGTGSARAGVFDLSGRQLARAVTPIGLNRPQPLQYEQDSEEIWAAVCRSVREARQAAGLSPDDIAAIGFDATCSLVTRDKDGAPISISASESGSFDTMLWMDHRARNEAAECSLADDPVVSRFGGRLSPEMQAPKLLWLKRHLPETWAKTGQIFDLCDYLTWRATGSPARSHSSLASKWGYEPIAPGARPDDFYRRIGLSDLAARSGIPEMSTPLGAAIGSLSGSAADALGLTRRCLVAPGLIDAYAGAIGVFASVGGADFHRKAALIAGTSSCVIRFDENARTKAGCWGGFRDVALPDLWLMEAGQSASGALLDHLIRLHPAGRGASPPSPLALLDAISERLAAAGPAYGAPLTVLPDFHGARSPVTDPELTGTLAGLTLDESFDGLCKLFWRACVGLACSIRDSLTNMPGSDEVNTLLMAGGFVSHPLIPTLYANVTGKSVVTEANRDSVLFGCAMHAMRAAELAPDFANQPAPYDRGRQVITPNSETSRLHERDYSAYLAMKRHRAELNAIYG
ncbi:FGGY-family pentulose kinase [Rhizobium sp. SG_E_25_P2]|uniref:FGGY-family carbohydrate kinase n=1 Tax=Rhizobium sp. SG_E_25_P2 TaxID=2879942 RepID=UPI0024754E69|nr:FGGY-family carbohydrate kinase [Rhizobium sp. SG_E_25_P2]MDH6267445.1 FGGY-family pentulose kinase [Rhizobium sp. SG_E_25_P2]